MRNECRGDLWSPVCLPLGGKVAFAEQMTDEGASAAGVGGYRPLIRLAALGTFPPGGRLFYAFSILYPSPHTTLMYLGLAGSISIFSRRWRMWTATVFSEPREGSFHTSS